MMYARGEFFVSGEPVPRGAVKPVPLWGKGRVVIGSRIVDENPAVLKPWMGAVRAGMARLHSKPLTNVPIALRMIFAMPRPPTVRRTWPTTRPDWDKLARAVGDALEGLLYKNDAQIVEAQVHCAYGTEPGVWIAYEEMDPYECPITRISTALGRVPEPLSRTLLPATRSLWAK